MNTKKVVLDEPANQQKLPILLLDRLVENENHHLSAAKPRNLVACKGGPKLSHAILDPQNGLWIP